MAPRRDSTDRQPHHWRFALAALFCMAVAGCGPEPQTTFGPAGSAAVNLKVTMPPNVAAVAPAPTGFWATVQRWVWGTDAWAASVGEITGLVVRVTGPGIGTPISSPTVPVSGAVSGLVIPVTLEVPVGADRVFAVAAVDAANRPIFQGQSEPVTLTADQPATVAIQLTDTTIRILPNPLPNGTEDRPYTGRLQAERGTGLTWTVQAGELPPGVRLDAATGALLGTSTRAGKFDFTIRVTDALGLFDEAQVTIRINSAPLPPTIRTTTLSNGTVGAPYRATLVAVDGTGAPTWSRSAGALPAGLNLDSDTGVISGIPTTEGRATFTVRATDTTPLSDEQELTIIINPAPVPPTITTTRLAEGTTQARYTAQLTKTGGTGDVTWRVVAGALPDGLRLTAATGALTGTPTKNGTFLFTIRVTDTLQLSDEQALRIIIKDAPKPPVIITESLPGGQVGAAYNAPLRATSTNGAVRWSSPNFPAGFTLGASTGVITGTPTRAGTVDFTVRATDEAGLSDEKPLFIQISEQPKPPIITTTTLPVGTVNVAYRAQLTATGGTGAVTWSARGLPAGLNLDGTTGVITGTPTAAGAVPVTVRATDTTPLSSEKDLTITIQNPILPPEITTEDLPEGRVGDVYRAQLTATTPNGAVTWTASGLPNGLAVNPTSGAITGTPTVARDFDVTVRATDPRNRVDEETFRITIRGNPPPVITTTALPAGRVGVVYSATLTATSQNPPVRWSASGLPNGLAVNPTSGVITGTPTVARDFVVTVRVTDARNLFTEKVLSLEIRQNPPVITTTTLPDGRLEFDDGESGELVGVPYSARLVATGGAGGYRWSVITGTLPDGLRLDEVTGEISGAPTRDGLFSFRIRVTDSAGQSASKDLSIRIVRPTEPLEITTTSLPGGTVGASYSATINAIGGTGARTWSLVGGTLPPPGLGFDGTTAGGIVAGTPTEPGTYVFTVRVSDASGATDDQEFSVGIDLPPLSIKTSQLADAKSNQSYSFTLEASGGVGPYTWFASGNFLPTSLTLNTNTGTISSPGIGCYGDDQLFTNTFQVVDQRGATTEKDLSLKILKSPTPCIN